MKNSEAPAFPLDTKEVAASGNKYTMHHMGLSKREYFAGLAMQGICANLEHIHNTYENTPEHELIVNKSLRIADELLKQLGS